MEPATTGKISIETTKGRLEIELWCKECPVTCLKLVQKVRNGELKGLKLVKNGDVRIGLDLKSNDKNPRVTFKRGYVGVDDDLVFGMDNGWQGLTIGKLVGESIYVLEKIDDEFECVVKSGQVIVPYFELEDVKVEEKEEVKEKVRPKRKINLGYEEEEDGFEMKSSYELMPKKGKIEKKREEDSQTQEQEVKPQEEAKTQDTAQEMTPEQEHVETKSIETEQPDTKESESSETKQSETKQSETEESDPKTSQSILPPLINHPDLNYPFDKYKDIPIETVRNHKYRI